MLNLYQKHGLKTVASREEFIVCVKVSMIYCLNTDVDLITTPSQPAFTCSKLSIKTLEQGVSVVNFE